MFPPTSECAAAAVGRERGELHHSLFSLPPPSFHSLVQVQSLSELKEGVWGRGRGEKSAKQARGTQASWECGTRQACRYVTHFCTTIIRTPQHRRHHHHQASWRWPACAEKIPPLPPFSQRRKRFQFLVIIIRRIARNL